MAIIEFNNVTKIYGKDTKAVDNFDIDVKDGEFIVFVGPSGCGKSTTLRMIAGLEDISGGEIKIDDVRINEVPAKDRNIAMVFQNYALYPHMSVYDNMAFALQIKKVSKEEIDKRVRNAAELLDLTNYLERKPKALSGGQRQRVALGRAIVRDAKVFLMDEPLSNLDAKLRVSTRAMIVNLHKKLKTNIIYVTHDQTEAMTMGDRIVVMKDGVIQQYDTPENIYSRPNNLFVAGFIGSPQMNFIKTTLVEDDFNYNIIVRDIEDSCILNVDKGYIATYDKIEFKELKDYVNKDLILGIRPEHLEITTPEESVFQMQSDIVEMPGSDIFIYSTKGLDNISVRSKVESKVAEGDIINVKMTDNKYIHLFDEESGKRIKRIDEI